MRLTYIEITHFSVWW